MDCHALPSGKARNDRGGSALACNDEKNAISKKVDSSTATTLKQQAKDSNGNAHFPSSRAAQSGVAIHNAKVDSSDNTHSLHEQPSGALTLLFFFALFGVFLRE